MPAWTLQELRARRAELLAAATRRGARRVRVFGSVARGDSQPSSDVDFVVQFDVGRSLLDHGGLQMDWQELLGCRVDVVSEKSLRDRMRQNVERDAVDL
ncbi:MAG: nucleotidyltransferase [Acidobacteria bacterium]|nr:MAG: nucleotidyltransferase [Acidobacteriota bacterium]MCE7957844.1 nucleotidyltransferase [Acidobacteria bacterium ACB2]